MADDIFKKLIPTPSITFEPVQKCIYCGSGERLSDEHIVPFALNGTMILPKSSCSVCRDITSKFELTVTRAMYGVLRNKRNYKTRHKKKRPSSLPVSYSTSEGAIKSIDFAMADYPSTYFVAYLPPPGVLTGAPLTDRNPEGIRLDLRCDPNEIERAISSIGSENIALSLGNIFPYGDFYRLLAKIAHGFLVASYGQAGYVAFLPDIILGRSPYLAHYVGGLGGDASVHMMSHHVSLVCLPVDDVVYLTVNIQLLGGVTMPTYQVIAAKITDFKLLTEIFYSKNAK
jgi:hypothetical protein